MAFYAKFVLGKYDKVQKKAGKVLDGMNDSVLKSKASARLGDLENAISREKDAYEKNIKFLGKDDNGELKKKKAEIRKAEKALLEAENDLDAIKSSKNTRLSAQQDLKQQKRVRDSISIYDALTTRKENKKIGKQIKASKKTGESFYGKRIEAAQKTKADAASSVEEKTREFNKYVKEVKTRAKEVDKFHARIAQHATLHDTLDAVSQQGTLVHTGEEVTRFLRDLNKLGTKLDKVTLKGIDSSGMEGLAKDAKHEITLKLPTVRLAPGYENSSQYAEK